MTLVRGAVAVASLLVFIAPASALTITNVVAPATAKPGEDVRIKWTTQSSGRITHTNVHWGTATKNYPSTSTVRESWLTGSRNWEEVVRMPAQGTVFLVIHARDSLNADLASAEKKIAIQTVVVTPTPTPTPTGNFVSAVARLHVDVDRDGKISAADDAGRAQWTQARGAVFAFNNDDDDGDRKLDGSDAFANGSNDSRTMTRVVAAQLTTAASQVRLSFAPTSAPVRVFKKASNGSSAQLLAPGSASAVLSAAELAAGAVELQVEATGPRSSSWDGTVTLTLEVTGATTTRDSVALRCAPVIYVDNTRPAERVYAMKISSGQGANLPFWNALSQGLASQGVPFYEVKASSYQYDRWVQDGMQLGYQGYLGPSGYAWIDDFNQLERGRGLGPLVPNELLGRNAGMSYAGKGQDESCNYGGNLEVLPPHGSYPFGRIYIGGGNSTVTGQSVNRHMNKEERAFLNAQVQGPIIEISSEWLAVGHVDEFSAPVPDKNAANGRPWKIVWSSPALARAALKDLKNKGLGSTVVFAGRKSQTTVNGLLNDAALMRYNEQVQARLDANKQKLISTAGLTNADFIEVPTLFEEMGYGGIDQGAALNPGVANCVPVNDTLYVPDPEGPRDGGVDVWRKQFEDAVKPLGLKVVFVDVFESYHEMLGEAHCGSNVRYKPYDAPWWSK